MTDSNLVRVLQAQTKRPVGRLGTPGVTYAIADALTHDDLRALAIPAKDLPLLVGGAGLALVYDRGGMPAPAPHPDGPAIALAGGEEIAPGVPWMTTVDTDPPLALALKSGNFGGPGFFLEALEA